MQGLFFITSAVVGLILRSIYHKFFKVFYFGSNAIFKELFTFFALGIMVTGITGGIIVNLFSVVFTGLFKFIFLLLSYY